MIKKASFMTTALVLLAAGLVAQGISGRGTNGIQITGFANYYGNAHYISVSVHLTLKGQPVSGATVRLNKAVITDRGNGDYIGAMTPYTIHLGDDLVFSVQLPKGISLPAARPSFKRQIVLATYRIANIIEWVFPLPGQEIDLAGYHGFIPLKWNFTGAPATTQLIIKDKTTNTEVYTHNIADEKIKLPTVVLRPGKSYEFIMWAVDPLDKFKNAPDAAPGSSVVFYFNDEFAFSTKGAFGFKR